MTLEALKQLWAEVLSLSVADIVADRDLNELGATALDSARVAARLRDQYGVMVSPGELAARPTVAGQLAMLRRKV